MTQEAFVSLINSNKYLQNKTLMQFIRNKSDHFWLERFGSDVIENKELIIDNVTRVDNFLKEKFEGYSHFGYFDKKENEVYLYSDYNYGTDDIPFIGISYINLEDLLQIESA